MNLHPIVAMSLSLHQHPGRYALLLGSGISSSAKVPTGWGITLDLIRQLAAAEGEAELCSPDPAKWYSAKTGKDPDYSEIIESLASKEDERQSLLRRYFEPADDEEREEGVRVPTRAHHAIAKLAKSGHIRVIVTLNFDRLLEEAMSAAGIHPNVVSSEDGVVGMVPLNHGEVTIIKLHGDYRDTRLRNTSTELASYPKHLQRLLDEVLERYGLIVCGWSSDWDPALRDSIRRMTRHRYQTYWMTLNDPSEMAQSIINHRDAVVVPITGADEAFDELAEKVGSLDSGRESDPLTPVLALQAAKRYAADPRFDVRYHDLLFTEVERVRDATGPDKMLCSYNQHSNDEDYLRHYAERARQMLAEVSSLVPIVSVGVYHGGNRFDLHWPRVLTALGALDVFNGRSFQDALKSLGRAPAVIGLYAIGICALARGRYDLLRTVLWDTLYSEDGRSKPERLVAQLSAQRAFFQPCAHALRWKDETQWTKKQKYKTPGSEFLIEELWPMLQPVLMNRSLFESCFDQLELIISLCNAAIPDRVPAGRFCWREDALDALGSRESPGPLATKLVQHGFFKGDMKNLFDAFDFMKQQLRQLMW